MEQSEVGGLDEFIVKKNIKLLTLGLAVYIFSKNYMVRKKDIKIQIF